MRRRKTDRCQSHRQFGQRLGSRDLPAHTRQAAKRLRQLFLQLSQDRAQLLPGRMRAKSSGRFRQIARAATEQTADLSAIPFSEHRPEDWMQRIAGKIIEPLRETGEQSVVNRSLAESSSKFTG